jgi:hypothetical protein
MVNSIHWFVYGYFEIFYAWARVNMHSLFGNFIKEVGLRFLRWWRYIIIDYCNTVCLCYCRDLFFSV